MAELSDNAVEMIARARELICRAEALQVHAVAQLNGLRAGTRSMPDELAPELGVSRETAQTRVALADGLLTRLPSMLAAMDDGHLDLSTALKIFEVTAPLPDENAWAADARLTGGSAARTRPGAPRRPRRGARRRPRRSRRTRHRLRRVRAGRHGPIPDTIARQIMHDPHSTWRTVLTDPESGAVFDVGRTRYRPPAALHEFVQVPDRECLLRGCHRPAQQCDLDHHVEWHDGGTTSACNLNCLCEYHHYLRNEPGGHSAMTGKPAR